MIDSGRTDIWALREGITTGNAELAFQQKPMVLVSG